MNMNPDPVKAQIFEMQMYADLFMKMQDQCWKKCIANTTEVCIVLQSWFS